MSAFHEKRETREIKGFCIIFLHALEKGLFIKHMQLLKFYKVISYGFYFLVLKNQADVEAVII